MGSPSVSVIIPIYRAQATLPRVLAALRPQARGDVEVIAVDSSGLDQAAALAAAHPWMTVVGLPERTLPGRARNLGAQRARGAWLAFLDADAVPAPDWLARLRLAARPTGDGAPVAVGGAVVNGTPGDSVGTSSYLLEFSEFIPGRRGRPGHAASCNLLVQRAAFDSAGGFPEDLWPGEDTVLTAPWASAGRLRFAQGATVEHLNRIELSRLIAHQYRLGRSFAVVCDRVEFRYSGLSRWPLLPVSPWLRLAALVLRLRGLRISVRRALPVLPLLVLGLVAWVAGVAAERARPSVGLLAPPDAS